MDNINMPAAESAEEKIKSYLKSVLPYDVYEKWIENFVFESIDKDKIVIGYYGSDSLSEFNKNYRELVWIHICAVVGYVKKIKVYKRKGSERKIRPSAEKKHFRAASLYLVSAVCAAAAIALLVLGGSFIENRNFRETFYSVGNLKVNNEIRIIQLSDLHKSVYGKNDERLISRITKLKPDIIVLTGDCVDSSDKSIDAATALCGELAKAAPTYYVYGNNEDEKYYDVPLSQEELDKKYGFTDESRDPSKLIGETDELEEALEKKGVKVLKNEFDTLQIGETTVDIYGVLTSNPSSFWSYAGESYDKYLYENENNLKIMALHEPFIFEEFDLQWSDIMLCGHTHGGLMRVPLLGPLYTHEGGFFPEKRGHYVYGRYDVSGGTLIVSSGLDNSNILRVNNQPELVIIDVNRF